MTLKRIERKMDKIIEALEKLVEVLVPSPVSIKMDSDTKDLLQYALQSSPPGAVLGDDFKYSYTKVAEMEKEGRLKFHPTTSVHIEEIPNKGYGKEINRELLEVLWRAKTRGGDSGVRGRLNTILKKFGATKIADVKADDLRAAFDAISGVYKCPL